MVYLNRPRIALFGYRTVHLLLAMLCTVLLQSCSQTGPVLINTEHQSVNRNERVRLLVLHYTAINWQQSLKALTQPGATAVSAHYLLPESFDPTYPADKALQVYQLVPETQRAWHAGTSRWEDRSALNDQSIGIELVNQGWCHQRTVPFTDPATTNPVNNELCLTPDFDPAQLQLLASLMKDILARNPEISPTRVVAHSDIAPSRKQDPGPRFPWQWLASQGIGAWYDNATLLKYWQGIRALPTPRMVQRALQRYGYGIVVTGEWDAQSRDVLLAFQRHFVPNRLSGEADPQTVAVLWALLEKYFPDSLSGSDSLALALQ
ncbi:MAG: N-acetylmuramoyl-L-alanine amidase [Rheinheimera sp.]|nr:N-acetylmuramoyl-L-alanine amidase [Rheinheimera sp.]